MAKLPKKVKKGVKDADAGGFAPIPAGVYECTIIAVTEDEGPAGPYWKFEFEVSKGKYKGRKLWRNASFAENALWVLKEILEATGYDEDVDSDDLEGEKVKCAVSQGTIQKGPRKGQLSNNIDRVMNIDSAESDDDDDDDDADEDTNDETESEEEGEEEEEEEEEKPKKKPKSGKKSKPDDDFEF